MSMQGSSPTPRNRAATASIAALTVLMMTAVKVNKAANSKLKTASAMPKDRMPPMMLMP